MVIIILKCNVLVLLQCALMQYSGAQLIILKQKKKRKAVDTKHIIYILFKSAPVLSWTCIYIFAQMLYRLSLHTSIWRFKQEIMGENLASQCFKQFQKDHISLSWILSLQGWCA